MLTATTRATALLLFVVVALTGPPARASDTPQAPEQAAARAASVFDAGGPDTPEFLQIAAALEPDPWWTIDALEALGRLEVAEALAKRAAVGERQALISYVERRRTGLPQTEARLAIRSAMGVGGAEGLDRLQAIKTDSESVLTVEALRAVARSLLENGEPSRASTAFVRACDAAAHIGWARGEIALCTECALLSWDEGDVEQARASLQRVVPLALARPNAPESAPTFLALGEIEAEADDGPAARRWLQRARESGRLAGLPIVESQATSDLGLLLHETGEFTSALRLHQEAASLLTSEATQQRLALEIRSRVAGVYELAGALPEARQMLEDVRDAFHAMLPPDQEGEAIAWGNLGRVEMLSGNTSSAHLALKQAESMFRELHRTDQVWNVGAHLLMLHSVGAPDPEVFAAVRAQLSRDGDQMSPATRCSLYEAVGLYLAHHGSLADALAALERAEKELADVPVDSMLHQDVLAELCWALARAERYDDAQAMLHRYLLGSVGHVDGLECGSARTFRGLASRNALEAGARIALSRNDAPGLWRVLEASRGIRLLAALGGRTALEQLTLPRPLAQEVERVWEAELAARRTLREGARTLPIGGVEVGRLKDALAQREAEHRAVAERVRGRRTIEGAQDLGAMSGLQTLSAARKDLTPDSRLLFLSTMGTDDEIVALIIGATEQRIARLPGRRKIIEVARGFRMEPKAESAYQRLEQLQRLLVAPLGLPASVRTLFVVPEGELSYVPFAALLPERDVTLLPSASVLALLTPNTRRTGTRTLALGDPDYTAAGPKHEFHSATMLLPRAQRDAWGARLSPLPESAREARGAAGSEGVALIGKDATLPGLLRALAEGESGRWRAIHFACHGLLSPSHPTLSGLALGDGLLKAHDIFGLRLNADVVVLSACETALDEYEAGEGITGLVRAFLYAGAPRVVASLWKIPDDSTAALMKEFHEALRSDSKMTIASALRRAQQRVREMEGGRWSAPWYWAGWTQWGLP